MYILADLHQKADKRVSRVCPIINLFTIYTKSRRLRPFIFRVVPIVGLIA